MRIQLFLSLAAIVFFSSCQNKNQQKLPFLGNKEAVERLENGKTVIDTVYQTIPAFSFINQDSVTISNKDFDSTIYVADFFFTSCASICPIMHQHMREVYNHFKSNSRVKFLSHSIDSKHDTPWVLKNYAEKLGVTDNQWQFVCGSQEAIYGIATNYLVSAYDDASDPQGRVHQGWFILVDLNKHIRGAYDGTKKEQVDKMVKDMEILLAECQGKCH
ncbi:MAG: SCO family protein [Sphingobacteriaceae bacterium]|nr:MAG: SCO family protein [Pedobacter sp.]